MAPGFEMEGDDNDYGIQKVDRKVQCGRCEQMAFFTHLARAHFSVIYRILEDKLW